MLQELDNLKKENAAIFSEKEYYLSECEHLKSENLSINNQFGVLTQELTDIKGQLYQAQQELSEAESVVQECVEEKKKLTSVNSNGKSIPYRLFFLRSIEQFFTQIYLNCFVSS